MATDKQISFVTSLLHTRWPNLGAASLQDAVSIIIPTLGTLDVRSASTFIDRIKNVPEVEDPDMPAFVKASTRKGVNSNTQPCVTCNHPVKAGTGYYYESFDNVQGQWVKGGWKVTHKVGECAIIAAPVSHAAVTEGFYKVDDMVIMVYKTSNNRLAGKTMDARGKFKYHAGAASTASCGRRLTWEEAAEYGKLHKRCIVCQHSLSDEKDGRSLDVGYGPVCAANNGWPWGTVKV